MNRFIEKSEFVSTHLGLYDSLTPGNIGWLIWSREFSTIRKVNGQGLSEPRSWSPRFGAYLSWQLNEKIWVAEKLLQRDRLPFSYPQLPGGKVVVGTKGLGWAPYWFSCLVDGIVSGTWPGIKMSQTSTSKSMLHRSSRWIFRTALFTASARADDGNCATA